jgi:hypothetical protein
LKSPAAEVPSIWETLAAAWLERFDQLEELADISPGPIRDACLEAIFMPLPRPLTEQEIARFRRCDPPDQRVLARLLDDRRGRHFVKIVASQLLCVPEGLLRPMVKAGVYTVDPSYNKQFIWPCVLCHGQRTVLEILLSIARNGSDFEKAGALNARYWVSADPMWIWPHRNTFRAAIEQSIDDINGEWDEWMIQEITCNRNTDVLRSMMYWLAESDNVRLREARGRLASHPDAYIRQRLAVQTGRSTLYPPLPHRSVE